MLNVAAALEDQEHHTLEWNLNKVCRIQEEVSHIMAQEGGQVERAPLTALRKGGNPTDRVWDPNEDMLENEEKMLENLGVVRRE